MTVHFHRWNRQMRAALW